MGTRSTNNTKKPAARVPKTVRFESEAWSELVKEFGDESGARDRVYRLANREADRLRRKRGRA